MLVWLMVPFYDFCGFGSVAVDSVYKLQFIATFAICYRPPVCLSSEVSLSVVCNVRAPYSGGSNFRQYFYGIRYLGHPCTFTENLTEIFPWNPSAGGVKHKQGSQV